MGAPKLNETQKQIEDLIGHGWTTTQIAAHLDLHTNSVDRWRKGESDPHGGNKGRLAELHAEVINKKGAVRAHPLHRQ